MCGWSIGGMIMTMESRNTWSETCPGALCLQQIPHGRASDQTWASSVMDLTRHAYVMDLSKYCFVEIYFETDRQPLFLLEH
jgi:hypothetical protein